MTQDLRNALEDLVAEGPPHLVPQDLARTAWSQGRRQRHRRQGGVLAAAALIVLGIVAAFLPITPHVDLFAPAGGAGSETVGGYPERIGHQWLVRDLPSKPGPMALLMQRYLPSEQTTQWEAVSESGQRWRVADAWTRTIDFPSLSPDGRDLAYLSGVSGPYVIQDLVTGRMIRFPLLGSAEGDSVATYQAQGDAPVQWSPDGRHLVLFGFHRSATGAIILGLDGSIHLVHGAGWPAGFADADTLVWIPYPRSGAQRPMQVAIRFTNLSGALQRSVTLATPMRPDTLGQWSGSVSPDRSQIAVLQELPLSQTIRIFSLTTGRAIGAPRSLNSGYSACATAWTGSNPVVMAAAGEQFYPAELGPNGPSRLVAIEPSLNAQCIVWAANALTGTGHPDLFGVSMLPLLWWWREILLGAVAVAILGWLTFRWIAVRRGRRGRRSAATAPGATSARR